MNVNAILRNGDVPRGAIQIKANRYHNIQQSHKSGGNCKWYSQYPTVHLGRSFLPPLAGFPSVYQVHHVPQPGSHAGGHCWCHAQREYRATSENLHAAFKLGGQAAVSSEGREERRTPPRTAGVFSLIFSQNLTPAHPTVNSAHPGSVAGRLFKNTIFRVFGKGRLVESARLYSANCSRIWR